MNICQYRFITVFIVRCLNYSLRKQWHFLMSVNLLLKLMSSVSHSTTCLRSHTQIAEISSGQEMITSVRLMLNKKTYLFSI